MYPIVRINKRVPDGSIWQARRGYLLPSIDGWVRAYQPIGTRWSNPLGGWTDENDGISVFHADAPFTISCHGPDEGKRFYIDIAHRVQIEAERVEFVDLFLDVMIDAARTVSEKDEHQLAALSPLVQAFARSARDEVLRRISDGDALFNPGSAYYAVPADAATLAPLRESLALN